MRNYFIPRALFDQQALLTQWANLADHARIIGELMLRARDGVLINERQFQHLFPNGMDGLLETHTELAGVSMLIEAPREPTPVVEAPVPTPTEGERLCVALSGMFEALTAIAPVSMPDDPFDPVAPRQTGTGIRVSLVTPKIDGYAPDHRGASNVYGMDRHNPIAVYSASGHGTCLLWSNPDEPTQSAVIAEAFFTADGGIDLFCLRHPRQAREALQQRTRRPDKLLAESVKALGQLLADRARLAIPRAERLAGQSAAFERFGVRAYALVQRTAREQVGSTLRSRDYTQGLCSDMNELKENRAALARARTDLAELDARYNDQIDQLLRHPKALLIEVDRGRSQNCLRIRLDQGVATNSETGHSVPFGRYTLLLHLNDARISFIHEEGPHHPYLQNGLHDTTSIDRSVAESLVDSNVFSAFRTALRFLQRLDPEHPWTPTSPVLAAAA